MYFLLFVFILSQQHRTTSFLDGLIARKSNIGIIYRLINVKTKQQPQQQQKKINLTI